MGLTPSSSEGGGIPQGGPLTSNLDADGKRIVDAIALDQVTENLTVRIKPSVPTVFSVTDVDAVVDNVRVAAGATAFRNTANVRYFQGGDSNLDLSAPSATGQLRLDDFDSNDLIRIKSTSLMGFFGNAPVAQPAAIANAAGGAIIDAEARTALNSALAALRTLGLIAT